MYVEFLKNFLLADSSKLILDMIYVELIRANFWLLDSFRPPEPKNVWFLLSRHDVRRVDEKFSLADSSELMAVRLISASWAQKRLIPTF